MFYDLATSGGNHGTVRRGADALEGRQLRNERLSAAFTADANDVLYHWDSSRTLAEYFMGTRLRSFRDPMPD